MLLKNYSNLKLFILFLLCVFAVQLFILVVYMSSDRHTHASGKYEDFVTNFWNNSTDISTGNTPITTTYNMFPKASPKDSNSIFKYVDASNDYLNVCVLPEYNFFDSTIKEYIVPDFNPKSECNKSQKPWTELINGTWRVTKYAENSVCRARCIYDNGDFKTKPGKWRKPGRVKCEILEVVCKRDEEEVYGNIHTQIIRKNLKIEKKFENQPNVFVILLDSMSTGMANRSLTKSLTYLKNKQGLIEFPYVNRVGENSRPNGVSLWFGKMAENAHNKKYGGMDLDIEFDLYKTCFKFLDDRSHIFDDFKSYGYVTMDQDSWGVGILNYPNCAGFEKPPSHHHMHPFQLTYEHTNITTVKNSFSSPKVCRERYNPLFEYFQQFIDAYPDTPKFSWTWETDLAHDDFNGLNRFDDFLLDFLKKNGKTLDESFLVLMGDHGPRMGDSDELRSTELFNFEKNNPFTGITVPRKYRKSKIVDRMRENSKQLQTHFDTRATLLDILWFQPQFNFSDTKLLELPGERGHSYFRYQPDTPRTCGHLPIPNGYCICRIEREDIKDPTLREFLGNQLVEYVHHVLKKHNFTSICEKMEFLETSSLYRLSDDNYEIAVKVAGKSAAHFQSFVHNDQKTGHLDFKSLTRMDRYGKTGDCTRSNYFEKFCYCKKQSE